MDFDGIFGDDTCILTILTVKSKKTNFNNFKLFMDFKKTLFTPDWSPTDPYNSNIQTIPELSVEIFLRVNHPQFTKFRWSDNLLDLLFIYRSISAKIAEIYRKNS